jgi:hypothetical protein
LSYCTVGAVSALIKSLKLNFIRSFELNQMTYYVKDRVLHYIYLYLKDVPRSIISFANTHEGHIPNRIGFNFPLSVVKRTDPTSHLLSYDAEYFIGYRKGDICTKRHELQHARFHLDADFRTHVQHLWDSIPPNQKQQIVDTLLEMKYPNDMTILLDEFQAYHFADGLF